MADGGGTVSLGHEFYDEDDDGVCEFPCGVLIMDHDELTALGTLDAAWAEAEAALPEGVWLRVEHDPSISDRATSAEAFEYGDVDAESPVAHVDAESPAAALRALAVKLREVGR